MIKVVHFSPFDQSEWIDSDNFDELMEFLHEIFPIIKQKITEHKGKRVKSNTFFEVEGHFIQGTFLNDGLSDKVDVFCRELSEDDFLDGISTEKNDSDESFWKDLDLPGRPGA